MALGSDFYELDCGDDEPTVIEVTADGDVTFHNFDPDAEAAAVELGFEPSDFYCIWKAFTTSDLEGAIVEFTEAGNYDVVNALIGMGANFTTGDEQPLRDAAWKGHTAVVELLLEAGADVHAKDDEALRWAASEGHADVVEVLLEAGAYVHAFDNDALRCAATNAQADVVAILKAWIEEHG